MDLLAGKQHKSINWTAIIFGSLAFWLSGSFILDFVVIPSLSVTGMMETADFASAGFTIFSIFNHIELVCASLVLTGILVVGFLNNFQGKKQVLFTIFSAVLFLITLAYTYAIIPNLTGWGLSIHQFTNSAEMSKSMIMWQESYWILEAIKFVLGGIILRWCYDAQQEFSAN